MAADGARAAPRQPVRGAADEGAGAIFAGEGEMRMRCRELDWSATPLGPVEHWPVSLRTTAAIVLAAPIGMILLWGPELVQLYNDRYRELMGDKHPRGLGQRNIECWPEVWDFTGPVYEGVLGRGESFTFTDQRLVLERHGAPDEGFFTLSYTPVPDDAGGIGGILVTVLETTAQVRARGERESQLLHANELLQEQAAELEAQAEELQSIADRLEERTVAAEESEGALRISESRLRALILSMPAPVALLDGPEHRFVLVNDAYKRISGGGRDVTGLTPPDAFPELAGSGIFELFDMVYRTGEPWNGPETLVRYDRDGTGVQDTWFDLLFQPLRDAEGQVTAILNFAVDVTDQVLARREIERLLRESEEVRLRHEALLASIGDAFYLLDREWRFTYVNDAAEPLLQTTRDRLIGRTLWDAFPGVAGSVFEGPYRESMATGKHTSVEAYFEPLDTWFDVHTYAWSGGVMVHFRDIGARVRADAERERLLEAAEAARAEAVSANRAKSQFLAVMSHELRTPLNAIDGYAELMELGIRGPLTAEQRTDLARIRRSQKSLLGLINGVLNYARVEAGAVHYDMESVSLEEVLATCEALVAPQAHVNDLTLQRSPVDPALVATADREKLQQVLLNLLSNAIKFTPAGGTIVVRCERLVLGGQAAVQVLVSDTGIGIAPHQLARVFEPFVQVDSELTRTRDGTGLGLAISRDLARGMGGELTAESVLGEGSTFTLTLRAHSGDE